MIVIIMSCCNFAFICGSIITEDSVPCIKWVHKNVTLIDECRLIRWGMYDAIYTTNKEQDFSTIAIQIVPISNTSNKAPPSNNLN